MSIYAINEIARIVESTLGYPRGAIAGEGRRREFIRARVIAYSLMTAHFPGAPDWTHARALGRDRSTMNHYRELLARDDPTKWPEYPECAARVDAFLRGAEPRDAKSTCGYISISAGSKSVSGCSSSLSKSVAGAGG